MYNAIQSNILVIAAIIVILDCNAMVIVLVVAKYTNQKPNMVLVLSITPIMIMFEFIIDCQI